jgi:dCMP deaminase
MKNKFQEYFMGVAALTANLSHAKRLKVGCIAVKDRRIICCGYNGTGPGEDNNCETKLDNGTIVTKPGVFHAEDNLIRFAKRNNIDLKGTTLYITHEPCEVCAELLLKAGIVEILAENEYTGSRLTGRELLGDKLKFLERTTTLWIVSK